MLPDGIYRGWVHHQRHLPNNHEFQYPLAMLMLDLDELQTQLIPDIWDLCLIR